VPNIIGFQPKSDLLFSHHFADESFCLKSSLDSPVCRLPDQGRRFIRLTRYEYSLNDPLDNRRIYSIIPSSH
jgi:hypothetical protein